MKNISFKLIFRSWRRNKIFTVISVFSLAVGIACTNLLAAFVIHEYNIEPDNPNRNKIVVAQQTITETGRSTTGYRYINGQSARYTERFISRVAELDKSTVINELYISSCKAGEHLFSNLKILESDRTFADLFPQQVLMGSLEEALSDPNKIVLTESASKRLFGRENPIGQTIRIQPLGSLGEIQRIRSFTVSAIIKKNEQSALMFEALVFGRPKSGALFFLLKDNVTIAELQAKTKNLLIYPDSYNRGNAEYSFLGLQQASLDKELPTSPIRKPNTNLLFIAFLSAILILAIACFNYINLSFSRVFKQLYSIHIQKLMGAGVRQLRTQLFADTFLTVGLGFLIAQLIQFDFLSILNRLLSARVPASFLYSNQVLPVTLAFILVLALIPAFYMSSRLPEMSISTYNNFYRGKAKQRIIASLAILQFLISLVLIIGTFTVRRQLSLVYEKIENYKPIYAFSLGDGVTSLRPLKERVAHFPGIEAIASSISTLYDAPGYSGEYTENGEKSHRFIMLDDGDEGIMDVMGHKIIQGLPWDEALKLYSTPVYLNQSYAQFLFPDGNIPIGDILMAYDPVHGSGRPYGNHVISGVVEDFFRGDMERPVDAAIIVYRRDVGFYLQVKIDPKQADEVIRRIYEEGNKLYPEKYLQHESVYDVVLNRNKKIIEMSDLLMMYSIISLLLTCFGLFGMALYAIEQRTKEIGIRKVNGSTTWQIMMMLNRQFIAWIAVAYVIAVPLSWWLLSRWMERFVYRAEFSIWTYILPLGIVVGITFLTVSWHSYRAASGNPVNALRDE
ncbi:FtsX-like permease family protein [Parabacteroides sp. PF5-6]|uniref:ABC transporter permease n=1 Tax=Parabacteroides sp. PF5-6 TaxID=1742403 RepID=UPI0024050F3F|nr:FtsX-like permease family protein [Parabacteroides sp. PF5-6]MDF9829152.1 putative ABC transport system permease protein [Parabacteroides sp. PF5-6]